MYHNIMWNWSWNHWTSPPAPGHWSLLTAWWTGHWLQPAVSCRQGSCWGEPEFKFSSGQSCAAAGLACTLYTCTVAGTVQLCGGRDWGRGEWSVWIQRSCRAHSHSQCHYTVLLQSVRESPAQGSVHRLAPVLVCSELTCVRPLRAQTARITNWKWKFEENLSL